MRKKRGKKYLIMGKQAQAIELRTELGINYIPCCSIVLMCYNVECMVSFEARKCNIHIVVCSADY